MTEDRFDQTNAGPGDATRPPADWQEALIANFRPQPAIPAALICMLAFSFAVLTQEPQVAADGFGAKAILITLGIVASCGLAIAAGFCSLFPQLIWFLLALWGLRLTAAGALAAYNFYVLLVGMCAVVAMFLVQLWRVRTGRFVPSIRLDDDQR
ncbi:MAG: hypothetical protein OEM91_15555 [Hyphomicrobiales bacterium]|nr:hypothetical protein [Hyphomicrobiales bacterium]